jgi:hypothetical protein
VYFIISIALNRTMTEKLRAVTPRPYGLTKKSSGCLIPV